MLCQSCKNHICEELKKPCEALEKEMRKEGIYSKNYIRPQLSSRNRERGHWKEIPLSNLRAEDKKRVEKTLAKGYWSD